MADKVQQTTINKKSIKKDYIAATGKRKEAIARVRLYQHVKDDLVWGTVPVKKGEMFVNEKPITQYFPSVVQRHLYTEPLRITNSHQNNYAFTIKVIGGGPASQLDAVIAGIAKTLQKLDPEKYRSILKKKGFLTRDARIRQRRNVGTGGKARRQKQSPKR
jgi:small subunit ribosomal protein S9